jgi:hypothetical protein
VSTCAEIYVAECACAQTVARTENRKNGKHKRTRRKAFVDGGDGAILGHDAGHLVLLEVHEEVRLAVCKNRHARPLSNVGLAGLGCTSRSELAEHRNLASTSTFAAYMRSAEGGMNDLERTRELCRKTLVDVGFGDFIGLRGRAWWPRSVGAARRT